MFGASFFILTGFHGAHVTIGVIWLLSLCSSRCGAASRQKDAINVEIAGLYWHFVDIVWIIIFTLVYLIPYEEVEGAAEENAEHAFNWLGSIYQAIQVFM